jgi:Homeodomain-like domain
MDRAWLHQQLAAGRSIESIAREVGRDPSTVSYWVAKFGLVSTHAAKHASRGGLAREELEPLVDAGLSVRAIADRLGFSYASVRHWLKRHGLETARTRRRRLTPRPDADGPPTLEGTCEVHGVTAFGRRVDGYYRCLACRSDAVVKRRRAVKQILVEEAGGACALCGYDRSVAALHFHHVDPATKAFDLSHRGVTRSLAAARAEAAKCVLLCANCHAEVEGGAATVR